MKKIFGKLCVIRSAEDISGLAMVVCKCECGEVAKFSVNSLVAGRITDCGCVRRKAEQVKIDERDRHGVMWSATHGKTGSKEHKLWLSLRNRSKKGVIKFDPAWENDFTAFLNAIPAPKDDARFSLKKGKSVYGPGNVEWRKKKGTN